MLVKYNPETTLTEVVGQPGVILRTHNPGACAHDDSCSIHKPSNHLLSGAPLNWRTDRGIMERICEHGVGHDDPDDLTYRRSIGREASGTHGCDGCCWDGVV